MESVKSTLASVQNAISGNKEHDPHSSTIGPQHEYSGQQQVGGSGPTSYSDNSSGAHGVTPSTAHSDISSSGQGVHDSVTTGTTGQTTSDYQSGTTGTTGTTTSEQHTGTTGAPNPNTNTTASDHRHGAGASDIGGATDGIDRSGGGIDLSHASDQSSRTVAGGAHDAASKVSDDHSSGSSGSHSNLPNELEKTLSGPRDPAVQGEGHPKMTGEGQPGSHSALFGLTPDGKKR
ncbi:uncharacterized protein HMPREF1541_01306 [Cyphellophora europaea CBS 101466]|uniref:Uncharacterized protein n=1 Tax=Cyphellophora europaea (strain CBS 101466) TaxID=1220924 RepID=W2SEF4_CYPE1|nr:uncharacterized protein HMPREF1541_01306 [Cyphellophora europaea CBS 101466]ETN47116.1 hypothetical protein HMPREF1541_01306 [Cyphellophora europaea CBS 101466]